MRKIIIYAWINVVFLFVGCASLNAQKSFAYSVQVGSFSNVENAGKLVEFS